MATANWSFRPIFFQVCRIWVLILAPICQIMVFAVWLMILIQNLDVFQNTMGTYMGNDVLVYAPADPNNGYVNNTNIPKHLAGAVFASALDVSMMIWVIISLAADLHWKFPYARQILNLFVTDGLWNDAKITSIDYVFLVANGFIKLFVVAVTGSQTYVGLNPRNEDVDTPLFCLYATFCLLGSIPWTIIATGAIIQNNKRAEYDDEVKKAEAGKKAKK